MVKLDKHTRKKLVDLCKKENDECIKHELESREEDFFNISKDSIMLIPYSRKEIQRIIKKTLKILPQEYTINIHEILNEKKLTPIVYKGITFESVYQMEHGSIFKTLGILNNWIMGYYSALDSSISDI